MFDCYDLDPKLPMLLCTVWNTKTVWKYLQMNAWKIQLLEDSFGTVYAQIFLRATSSSQNWFLMLGINMDDSLQNSGTSVRNRIWNYDLSFDKSNQQQKTSRNLNLFTFRCKKLFISKSVPNKFEIMTWTYCGVFSTRYNNDVWSLYCKWYLEFGGFRQHAHHIASNILMM